MNSIPQPQKVPSSYPPEHISPDHLHSILTQIKDYQTNHGSLLKVIGSESPHSVRLQPVSVSVFPTVFPRRLFNEAVDELQLIYNELYCKLAEDAEWLYGVTGPLRGSAPLVDALWSVYEEVQRRRQDEGMQYIEQRVHAGVFRSDYMLHVQSDSDDDGEDENWTQNLCLKQVEFNSYSCAGGCHADKVAHMHRFLARKGVYDFASTSEGQEEHPIDTRILPSSLPQNNTINGIASLLASAHKTYGLKPYNSKASRTAVLIVVQPNNFNIADERPIEYALWNWTGNNDDYPIPTYRIEWQAVLSHTHLTQNGELLFFPPENRGSITNHPVEISVIYHRAGYEPHEYSEEINGKEIRTILEFSRAIKCPSILGHITTIKKVQQALTVPGTLERWLTSEKADRIRRTFVEIRSLEDLTSSSQNPVTDGELAETYILKPASLEGGGHNIYGADIPAFLKTLSSETSERSAYILMQRIRSPFNVYGMLISSSRGVVVDEVVSELGIIGGCLWERKESFSEAKTNKCQVIVNRAIGWSFKTKEVSVDEMSVVKGYGCFDTPFLVD